MDSIFSNEDFAARFSAETERRAKQIKSDKWPAIRSNFDAIALRTATSSDTPSKLEIVCGEDCHLSPSVISPLISDWSSRLEEKKGTDESENDESDNDEIENDESENDESENDESENDESENDDPLLNVKLSCVRSFHSTQTDECKMWQWLISNKDK